MIVPLVAVVLFAVDLYCGTVLLWKYMYHICFESVSPAFTVVHLHMIPVFQTLEPVLTEIQSFHSGLLKTM